MRVLGVDPGTHVAGYGVLESDGARVRALCYGVIRGGAGAPLPERLQRVFRGVSQVIATWRPHVLAIEEAFVWKNARSALAIGEARAVAMLAATEAGILVREYAPSLVKKAVTGRGAATKTQVQEMVRRLLALDRAPEPVDATDALAVAFCHVHRARGPAVA
jgi:crossover junction endodeoxyribonuclease RuvC